MKTNMGLWIDHRKAVIVIVSEKGEETNIIESSAEKQLDRFDGVRSTTPYDESQKVQAYKEKTNKNSVLILTTDSDFYQYIKQAIPGEKRWGFHQKRCQRRR